MPSDSWLLCCLVHSQSEFSNRAPKNPKAGAGAFIPTPQPGRLRHIYLRKQLAPGSQSAIPHPAWFGTPVS